MFQRMFPRLIRGFMWLCLFVCLLHSYETVLFQPLWRGFQYSVRLCWAALPDLRSD
jgi:hypothetical protein